MDSNFVDILKQLIAEHGKDRLLSHEKCKPLLADFTRNEYKKECRLLLNALEAGVSKAINNTEELEICKKQQVRKLHEEYELVEETAVDLVETLVLVLRGEQESETPQDTVCSNCGKDLDKEWKVCPYCSTQVAKPEAPNTVTKTKKKKSLKEVIPSLNKFVVKELIHSGEYYRDKGQYVEAIKEFDKAIELDPNDAITYISRGQCYMLINQYDNAIIDFDNAIRLDHDATAYNCRGLVYIAKGQYDNAREDFDIAIIHDPNNYSYYINRGQVYKMKGQYDIALRDFDNAIKLCPECANIYAFRGLIFCQQGHLDKGIDELEYALNLDPALDYARQELQKMKTIRGY